MKAVLGWITAHLVIVIAVIVTVVSLPALLFVSMGMNKSVKQEVADEISNYERTINGLTSQYRIPSADPMLPPVEFSRTPNEATTNAIKSIVERLKEESQEVVQVALERNSADKRLIMEGFFPEPTGASTRLRQEFSRAVMPAYEQLLTRYNIGSPPSPQLVATQIRTQYDQQKQRRLAGSGEENLSPEAEQQLKSLMTDRRISMYRDRAQSILTYGDRSMFVGVSAPDLTTVDRLPMAVFWDLQHRYWVYDDILRAIELANTGVSGQTLTVPAGAVKRIESIIVPGWDYSNAGQYVGASADVLAPPNYEVSITGRAGWPANPNSFYDVRYADVELLVASTKIPRVLDAINAVDLMSVVSFRVTDAQTDGDLHAGYYYGDESVVRLSMRVETLWLRAWMEPLMPTDVKEALGIAAPGGGSMNQFEDFGD